MTGSGRAIRDDAVFDTHRRPLGDLVSLGRAVHVILQGEPEPELTERIWSDLSR